MIQQPYERVCGTFIPDPYTSKPDFKYKLYTADQSDGLVFVYKVAAARVDGISCRDMVEIQPHMAKRLLSELHAYLRQQNMPVPGPGPTTDTYMQEAETAVKAQVQADCYTKYNEAIFTCTLQDLIGVARLPGHNHFNKQRFLQFFSQPEVQNHQPALLQLEYHREGSYFTRL